MGYLHGRERAWQMEVYRRATGGRLSEIFGAATVRADKRFLALGLRRAASAEWQTATPAVRTALQRYADGVNAAFASMGRWRRPPELQLLRLTPEPWTPVDSLAVARLLAWRLAENRRGELVRGLLGRAVGASVANTLMGPLPPGTPAIIQGAARVEPTAATSPDVVPGGPVARLESPPMPPGLEWLDVTARAGGSNSWVIAGFAYRNRTTAAGQRPAPERGDAVDLVRGACRRGGSRRRRRHPAEHAVRHHRPQQANRLGPDEHRRRCRRLLCRGRRHEHAPVSLSRCLAAVDRQQVRDRCTWRAARTLRGLLHDSWAARGDRDRVGGSARLRERRRPPEPQAAGAALGSVAAGRDRRGLRRVESRRALDRVSRGRPPIRRTLPEHRVCRR